jgi:hypothetical protein
MTMMRQMMGGSPEATQADLDALAQAFDSSEQMRAMFELVKADHDGAQGPSYWKTHFTQVFDRLTQPPDYTIEDLHNITVPTLILTETGTSTAQWRKVLQPIGGCKKGSWRFCRIRDTSSRRLLCRQLSNSLSGTLRLNQP